MTWLVNKLTRRIQFAQQVQTPDDTTGGAKQTYKVLAKVWAGVENVGTSAGAYIRGVQVEDAPTHKVTVRRSIPMGVDITDPRGFVKSDNYILLLSSHTPTVVRLMKILKAANVGERDEYLEILVKEMAQLDASKGIIQ